MTNLYLILKRNVISLIHVLQSSQLQSSQLNDSKVPSVLPVHTDSLLVSFLFSANHIGDIIKKLDSNKAHGHELISILKRMLKLCGDSIWKPLEIIFKNCLKEGVFPNEWKKANVVPIHEKK